MHFTNLLEWFCKKKTLQKTPNLRQMGPVLKSAILSDPIPYKILTLGLKLKFQKTCENPFYNSFTVVRCKKPLQKPLNIREMGQFQNRPLLKKYSPCKILTFAQKVRIPKHLSKSILKINQSCSLQKTAPKNTWEHFENRLSCKGYSPYKILTLGHKLKFKKTCHKPFYKSFGVVLCKTPLQKTLNIPEMGPF